MYWVQTNFEGWIQSSNVIGTIEVFILHYCYIGIPGPARINTTAAPGSEDFKG